MCMARAALILGMLGALTGTGLCQSMPASSDNALEKTLISVKSVCVGDIAGEKDQATLARELATTSLFSTRRFTIREKCAPTDSVLKGAVLSRSEMSVRAEKEETGFGVASGRAHASDRSGTAALAAAAGSSGEALYSSETRGSATVALRLVSPDGTVIWAYTQDSRDGKTKSALVDAVERAIRQLTKDIENAERDSQ